MKKMLPILLIAILLISITSCSDNAEKTEPNLLIGKIYMLNTPLEKEIDFDWLKFYDDNTFQGIKIESFDRNNETKELVPTFTNFYGTYTIDGNALSINLSDNTYAWVIGENGESIKSGKTEFVSWKDHIDEDDPLFKEFQQ